MVALQKGSQAKFVEIEQNDVSRRFIIPDMQGLEGRLANFIKKYPGISLVRVGRAIVASKDEMNPLTDGVEGVPSTVDSSYMIDLCGDHPVLGQGPARYSLELINALAHENVVPTEPIQEEQGQTSIYDFTAEQDTLAPNQGITPNGITYSTPPKPDLAASLRAQMRKQEQEEGSAKLQDLLNAKLNAKKEEPVAQKSEIEVVRTEGAAHAAPVQDYSNAFPHLKEEKKETQVVFEKVSDINKAIEDTKSSKTQNDLNKAIEKARQKREQERKSPRSEIKIMEPRPLGKIDILLEKVDKLERFLYDGLIPEDGESITGEELAEWFYKHLDTIGHEKTFDILASRLKEN